jgi:hypothetical protein
MQPLEDPPRLPVSIQSIYQQILRQIPANKDELRFPRLIGLPGCAGSFVYRERTPLLDPARAARQLSSVVLPLPRKPVRIVTGIRVAMMSSLRREFLSRNVM